MSEEYPARVLHVAAAKICDSSSIQMTSKSCMNMLVNLAINHITEIASRTSEATESSGRTVSNALDVALTLEDMGQDISKLQAFYQEQRVDPLSQVPIEQYPNYTPIFKNNPISTSAPIEITIENKKPILKILSSTNQGSSATVEGIIQPLPPHIPPYLPLFPYNHTFSQGSGSIDVYTKDIFVKSTKNEAENSKSKVLALKNKKLSHGKSGNTHDVILSNAIMKRKSDMLDNKSLTELNATLAKMVKKQKK